MCAVLHYLGDRRDPRGARELPELGQLRLSVDPLRKDPNDETALRLRPWRGIGLASGHAGISPRWPGPVPAPAARLAARTLELVDIPSVSRGEAAIREHLLALITP